MTSRPSGAPTCPDPAGIRALFSRIAGRYDLLNRLLTLGLEPRWRHALLAAATPPPAPRVLDLCAGTGELARHWLRLHTDACLTVLADFCPPMLALARAKLPPDRAALLVADALRLPFASACFDVVLCGFSLRNLADWRAGLAEMARLLRPGGELLLLEVCREPRPRPAELYLRRAVPWLGGLLSGDPLAYAWLPRSVDLFVSAADLAAELRSLGLTVRWRHTPARLASLFWASRPAGETPPSGE